MGRPTENPQTYQATVRFDEECKEILDEYCSQEQVGRNEAIRRGIKKLKCDIKNKCTRPPWKDKRVHFS